VVSGHAAHAASAGDTLLGQLERLTALRDKGALTHAEFETQKRKLLGES
jgi:Short C-terminal domain